MPPTAFRELLTARPFVAFDVRMTNDRIYHVDHPEFVILAPHGRSAVIYRPDTRGFVVLACRNIASLEPVEA